MNEFRERGEKSTEAIFPLKALGPTQILYVSVFARPSECRAALVGLAAAMTGGREGGRERRGGGTAPPAERWSKTTTGSLCSHLHSAQSHVNCSVNAEQQPIEGEILNVFLIALFLIHYMTAL